MAAQKKKSKAKRESSRKAGLISIILSFRNEEEVLPELIERLDAVFSKLPDDYELIFIDDDSTDGSNGLLAERAAKDSRIKLITMTRRFGVAECLMAGIAHSSGDAVVYMDTDLQDPPEVIPEMIEKWRDGAEVVYTVRTHRHGELALKMWLVRMAYRMINVAAEVKMPVNAGDFRLLGRRVYKKLLSLEEKDPYPRGLVPWIGYRQEPVYYQRDERAAGDPINTLLGSLDPYKVFVSGMTSFSMAPIFLIFVLVGRIGNVRGEDVPVVAFPDLLNSFVFQRFELMKQLVTHIVRGEITGLEKALVGKFIFFLL